MPQLLPTKYTRDQREAVADAYNDRGIRPARKVVALARAGELRLNGELLAPFDMAETSVRSFAAEARKRRAGRGRSALQDVPHRDAIDSLRRRFIACADAMLGELEVKKPVNRDPERLRQIIRVAREAAALPATPTETAVKPGETVRGKHHGGATRGGLAGDLMRAHQTERTSHPADELPDPTSTEQTLAPEHQDAQHTAQDTGHTAGQAGQARQDAGHRINGGAGGRADGLRAALPWQGPGGA